MNNEKKPTREEIVRSLRWCSTGTDEGCGGCTFEPEHDEDAVTCVDGLCSAAADLIDQLTDRCARYAEEIMELKEQLKREKAARKSAQHFRANTSCQFAPWCDHERHREKPVGADDPVRPNDDRNSRDKAG